MLRRLLALLPGQYRTGDLVPIRLSPRQTTAGQGARQRLNTPRAVQEDSAGAGVLFAGEVQDHGHGREVTALEHSVHPAAGEALHDIALEVLADHADVVAAVAWHRFGPFA